ncbi:hypothetical protein BT69DRAFT_1347636 [Atractiella rhizophila]|nr:hypothetical protein BT69DRAFT_1347636 [Atractiella rhizophila]
MDILQRLRDAWDSGVFSPFPRQPLESKLSTAEWKEVTDNAAFEGTLGGTAGAFVSSFVGGRILRLPRQAQSLTFFIALPLISWNIAQVSFENRRKHAEKKKLDLIEMDMDRREGGARGTGLEEMEDPYQTSRGDH